MNLPIMALKNNLKLLKLREKDFMPPIVKKILKQNIEEHEEVINFLENIQSGVNISISFAEFIISDYEIVEEEEETSLWRLLGTEQKYTSKELFNLFIKQQ